MAAGDAVLRRFHWNRSARAPGLSPSGCTGFALRRTRDGTSPAGGSQGGLEAAAGGDLQRLLHGLVSA